MQLDDLIAISDPQPETGLYTVGWFLAYWVAVRHGEQALEDLWLAVDPSATAAEFRAGFEQTLGGSLDELVEDVDGQNHCQFVTCVGEPSAWVDGSWTVASPQGCEADVVGIRTPDHEDLRRYGLVAVEEAGFYEVTVTAAGVSVSLALCGRECGLDYTAGFSGTTTSWLAVGVYRAEAYGIAGQAPYEIQIRPEP